MKILLDENFPLKLKSDLTGLEAYTVSEMNWKGRKNGELLSLMEQNDFNVLLTVDKNLKYQQNLNKFKISIIILNLKDTREKFIKPLIPKIIEILNYETLEKISEIFG